MAVRADVFRKHKFDEDAEMGSETEFTVRTEGSGHRCWHFHASPVGHIIRAYQLEPEWHRQRAYAHGRGTAMIFHKNNKEALEHSLHRLVRLIKGAGRVAIAAYKFAGSRLLGDEYDQVRAYLDLQYRRGVFAERCALARAYRISVPDAARW